MSENDDFDIDSLDDDLGGDVVRQLRKAYKSKQKEIEQLRKQVEEFSTANRNSVIEGTLTANGLDARMAKFMPAEVVTADDVTAWLNENADIFGISTGDPQESSEEVQAASRMADITSHTPAASAGDLMSRIEAASSQEELNEVLFGNPNGPVK